MTLVLLAALVALSAAAQAAVQIDACGTLGAPGEYVLNASVAAGDSLDCITITASDVALDCAGFTISLSTTPASESSGVTASSVNNVMVKNCIIDGFEAAGLTNGVKLNTVTNASVEGNIVYAHGGSGILLQTSTNAIVANNFLSGNQEGVTLAEGADGGVVANNVFFSNAKGIGVYSSDGSFLENNSIDSNGYAVYAVDSANNVLNGNTITNSYYGGIYIAPGGPSKKTKAVASVDGGNVFFNNTISGSAEYGIEVQSYANNTLDANVVSSNCNGGSALQECGGIGFYASGGNTVKNNQVNQNNGYGFYFENGGNFLENNVVESNAGDGIYFIAQATGVVFQNGNELKGNSANSNGNDGIVFDGVSENVVESNVVNSNTNRGFRLRYSSGNVFSNNEARLNGMALYAEGSTGTLTDDVIRDSTGESDALFASAENAGTNFTFLSVDFGNYLLNDGNSVLNVEWFLNARVENQEGGAVAGAAVAIEDVDSNEIYSGVTDANGSIPTQAVLEFTQTGTFAPEGEYTPYHITASKYGVVGEVSEQVTQDTDAVLILTLDLTPPVISNARITDVTQNTVTIAWDTDEPANESLDYGPGVDYGSNYANAALATTHSAFFTTLSASTLYHYKIGACDAYANCAQTEDFNFTTVNGNGGTTGGGANGGSAPTGGGGSTSTTPAATATASAAPAVETASPPASPTAPTEPNPTLLSASAGAILGGVAAPANAPVTGGVAANPAEAGPATGFATAANADFVTWGGILLLLILLAVLAQLLRRKLQKPEAKTRERGKPIGKAKK